MNPDEDPCIDPLGDDTIIGKLICSPEHVDALICLVVAKLVNGN